jgi:hypothetical protein
MAGKATTPKPAGWGDVAGAENAAAAATIEDRLAILEAQKASVEERLTIMESEHEELLKALAPTGISLPSRS